MILRKKRPHLVLKTPPAVMRLLRLDVLNQCADVPRTYGKQPISALPRELRDPMLLHPKGGSRFDLRHNLRGRSRSRQPHRKMNMVGNPAHAEAFAIELSCSPRNISVQPRANLIADRRQPVLGTEHYVNQIETQRLRHGGNYMSRNYVSGFQPSCHSASPYLGLRPRLVCHRAFSPQFTAFVGGS
jgi:hypothetical protein